MLLTAEGFDTPNSINHLLITLAEDILRAGHQLMLVSSHKTGIYEDTPKELTRYPEFSHHIVRRRVINKNSFVRRYFDEVKFAFSAFKIWRQGRASLDVIVLQSNPLSVLHAVLLRMFTKAPIVLNMYDVFPGHAFDIGVIKSKVVYHVLRMTQKVLYKLSHCIVAMSADMQDKLLAERVPSHKIVVVNNWFDDEVFTMINRDNNRFIRKYQIDPSLFYVQFAGLLGYVFDYELFIDTAKLLENEKDIRFLLIGDGNLKESILNQIHAKGVGNVLYYPWQPLEIISDVYSACDIGFIPLKTGVIGYGIPSKACQLMAAKRVIVNSVEASEYTKLFNEHGIGFSVTSRDPHEVARVIMNLYRNPELVDEVGERAQKFAQENYSREKNTAKFIHTIEVVARDRKCE